jgi:hypothetical protein
MRSKAGKTGPQSVAGLPQPVNASLQQQASVSSGHFIGSGFPLLNLETGMEDGEDCWML